MASPTLDGSATGIKSTTNNNSATLTTSNTNDIICVIAYCEKSPTPPSVTSVTGGGLTFQKRKALLYAVSDLEIWWALAPSALSATVITANYSASFDDASMIVFGVSGCNTSSPWDGNASVPATYTAGANGTPSFTGTSTSSADDFLIFSWGAEWSGTSTAVATGFTNIATSQNSGGGLFSSAGVAYERVSAKQSSATFTWGGSINGTDVVSIFDALTADASVAGGPARPRQMIVM